MIADTLMRLKPPLHQHLACKCTPLWLAGLLALSPVFAQNKAENSNLWPVHTDSRLGFRISYPPDWIQPAKRSANTRFSANPPAGPGNCNVVAKPVGETRGMSQAELNVEVQMLGIDAASWQSYIGAVGTNVRVVSARRAAVGALPAIVGFLDVDLENLQGKYVRRQLIAMTMTPGLVWSVNCGVSVANGDAAQRDFARWSPTFDKVLGSFAFTK